MKDVVPKMKERVVVELSKVSEKKLRIDEAVLEVSGSLDALRENARVAEEFTESAFAQVREDLEQRLAQLLQEIETARHQKEKELRLQKEALEGVAFEIAHSSQFTQAFLQNGTSSEVALGHQRVLARLETLAEIPCVFQPVKSSTIEFAPDEREKVVTLLESFGKIRS